MSDVRTIDRSEYTALVNSGALVIDVRTLQEYCGIHMPLAVNIPHEKIAECIREYCTDLNRTIVVYCQSGGRSRCAAQSLAQAGYTAVCDAGGISSILPPV